MTTFLDYALSDMGPDLQARIDDAKALANRVSSGTGANEDELIKSMIWFISKYYRIPVFSPYFEDRTLDHLIYESELIALESKPQEVKTSDILNRDKVETEALFDDWAEDDFQEVAPQDEQWQKDAAKFMETGAFK